MCEPFQKVFKIMFLFELKKATRGGFGPPVYPVGPTIKNPTLGYSARHWVCASPHLLFTKPMRKLSWSPNNR